MPISLKLTIIFATALWYVAVRTFCYRVLFEGDGALVIRAASWIMAVPLTVASVLIIGAIIAFVIYA